MGARRVGMTDSYGGYRSRLVEELRGKGIRDMSVLHAVSQLPRHLFVPEAVRHRAYEDAALPLTAGQTISQPWVQARSLELLRLTGREKVLEIGAGSGYQTALLTMLASAVFAVERVPALAHMARASLEQAGITTVNMMIGDGTLGWRAYAPFDAILVAAGAPDLPAPLLDQLAPGGRMVIPVGPSASQTLTLIERSPDGSQLARSEVSGVRFVPLLGQFGHAEP